MKKKVGIVTIYDCLNYGNRLQNYALYKVVSDYLGCRCRTLVSVENRLTITEIKIKLYEYLAFTPLKKYLSQNPVDRKYWNFRRFTRKYIPTRFYRGSYYLPDKLTGKFDYFIAGSDQIWNYQIPGRFKSFEKHSRDYFLQFARPEQRISYAASFGVAEIDDDKKETFQRNLETFRELSVRETEGQKIIKNLTGRLAEINIDPTLLLAVGDYEKIISIPRGRKSDKHPYILKYFLGGLNQENQKNITQYTKEKGYQEVNLLDPAQREYYASGPSEFLYWIKNAEMICTDSFHAAVFSIIFRRPFVVFDRDDGKSMNSRINSLLSEFNLERRYVNNRESLNGYENIDYSGIDKQIEIKKKQAISYLRRSLELD